MNKILATLIILGLIVSFSSKLVGKAAMYFFEDEIYAHFDNPSSLTEKCSGNCDSKISYSLESYKGKSIAIGFGALAHATRWYCVKNSGERTQLGDFDKINLPGRFRATSNRYQWRLLYANNDCQSVEVEIFKNQRENYASGWLGGDAIVGTENAVSAFAFAFDFFNIYFRIFLAFGALFLFCVSFFMRTADAGAKNPFCWSFLLCFAYLATGSGVMDFIDWSQFPTGFSYQMPRFLVSFTLVLIFLELRYQYNRYWWKSTIGFLQIGFGLAVAFFSTRTINSTSIYPIFLTASSMIAGFYALRRKDMILSILCVSMLLNLSIYLDIFVKPLQYTFNVVFIFIGFALLASQTISQFRLQGTLQKLRKRLFAKSNRDEIEPEAVIRYIQKVFKVGTVQFNLSLPSGRKIRYFDSKKKRANVNYYSKNQVFTDKIHVRQDNRYSSSLNQTLLVFSSKADSTLTFSGYPSSVVFERNYSSWFEQTLSLSSQIIGDSVIRKKREFLAHLQNSLQKTSESSANSGDFVLSFLDKLSSRFSVKVLYGTVSEDYSVSFTNASGYNHEVASSLLAYRLEYNSDSDPGPIFRAVSKASITIVDDAGEIIDQLRPRTRTIFELNKTASIAVVPICQDLGSARVSHVLWIEVPVIGLIDETICQSLVGIQAALATELSNRLLSKEVDKITNIMESVLPQTVTQKLTAGEDVREKDFGILYLFDIRGSTKLAEKIGSQNYMDEILKLSDSLKKEMSSYGLVLQSFIWDAFHFTKSMSSGSKVSEHDLFIIYEAVNLAIESWINGVKEKFQSANELDIGFRACATIGDITRDLVPGPPARWTIVGTAIAVVSKLEICAKEVPFGGLFVLESDLDEDKDECWNVTEIYPRGVKSPLTYIASDDIKKRLSRAKDAA